ncbi:hypothetical protein PanWU01x14_139640 [Parasponia andersonii]|uniref:Uncharacterized protein n=1 Tax=Parasponia andersonii TaxID=3476 RepID=A0A2P5CMK3_PARAD|nr:hypothetical protein PanWU01x14_139640 [Parasponia andersonii]
MAKNEGIMNLEKKKKENKTGNTQTQLRKKKRTQLGKIIKMSNKNQNKGRSMRMETKRVSKEWWVSSGLVWFCGLRGVQVKCYKRRRICACVKVRAFSVP